MLEKNPKSEVDVKLGFGSSKLSEWIQNWGINAVRIGDHPFKFTIPLRITGYLPIMETIHSQFLLFGGGETLLKLLNRG